MNYSRNEKHNVGSTKKLVNESVKHNRNIGAAKSTNFSNQIRAANCKNKVRHFIIQII